MERRELPVLLYATPRECEFVHLFRLLTPTQQRMLRNMLVELLRGAESQNLANVSALTRAEDLADP